jgi:hypothetical protein
MGVQHDLSLVHLKTSDKLDPHEKDATHSAVLAKEIVEEVCGDRSGQPAYVQVVALVGSVNSAVKVSIGRA